TSHFWLIVAASYLNYSLNMRAYYGGKKIQGSTKKGIDLAQGLWAYATGAIANSTTNRAVNHLRTGWTVTQDTKVPITVPRTIPQLRLAYLDLGLYSLAFYLVAKSVLVGGIVNGNVSSIMMSLVAYWLYDRVKLLRIGLKTRTGGQPIDPRKTDYKTKKANIFQADHKVKNFASKNNGKRARR
ncbi:MAG: hypothetical protein V1843_01000, partial [bacterium]